MPGLFRLGLTLVVIFAVFVLIVYLRQDSMIFFPVKESPRDVVLPEGVERYELTVDGHRFHGWLVNGRHGADRLLIYYGGNAENLYYSLGEFRQLKDTATLLVPYRGYNGNPGTPSQKKFFGDALEVIEEAEQRLAPRTVFLMGRSIGSGVACYVASRKKVDGVILVTPFDSMEMVAKDHYRWLPVSLLMRHRFPSTKYTPLIKAPALVIYGGEDRIVLPPRTEALLKSLPKSTRVLRFAEAGHNDIQLYVPYWPTINGFIEHHSSVSTGK